MKLNWPTSGTVLLVGNGASESSSQSELETLACEHAKQLLSRDEKGAMLMEANTHPDFILLTPEKSSAWIKVDQIRNIIDWSQSKPQLGPIKVAIISPAQALNPQAANAFLKTLEEPLGCLFILVTTRPFDLLPTIRSRCHWLRIRSESDSLVEHPKKAIVKEQLQALRTNQVDPISVAKEWSKLDPIPLLECLWLVLSEQTLEAAKRQKLARNPKWWTFLDLILAAKRDCERQNPPNTQLLFESLFIEYVMATQAAKRLSQTP